MSRSELLTSYHQFPSELGYPWLHDQVVLVFPDFIHAGKEVPESGERV